MKRFLVGGMFFFCLIGCKPKKDVEIPLMAESTTEIFKEVDVSPEIDKRYYTGLNTDYSLYPEMRPAIRQAMADGIVTQKEFDLIETFRPRPDYKAKLKERVDNDGP